MEGLVYAVVSQHDFDSESRLEGLFKTEEEAEKVKLFLEELHESRNLYCYIEIHIIREAEEFIANVEY